MKKQIERKIQPQIDIKLFKFYTNHINKSFIIK